MSISNEYAQRDEKMERKGGTRKKEAFYKQETYITGYAIQ